MTRPTTKQQLIEQAQITFATLWQIIDDMTEQALNTKFDFSDDLNKKEAHWQRDKNLRDILIHLYEWQQLLLNWIINNRAGKSVSLLPAPYNWKTYQKMNVEFWQKHQNTQLEKAKDILKASHKEVLSLIDTFSDEELFSKKYFSWTGTTTLGSYCISTLSSHYDWANKKLRAHTKKITT